MFQFLRRPVARDVAAAWLTAGLMLQTATAAAPDWWAVRGVYKAGAAADDYAVANVGQLKHIASRAAAEMNATLAGGAGDMVSNLVASWHESASPRDDYSALTAGQLKQVARMFYDRLAGRGAAAVYPWGSPLPADDHAIVNTGQVKRVFSFPVDSNGNTLPDLWEMLMFGHLGEALNTDFDGDGLSNLQEWSFGTSAKNQDSDDDGYFDGDEHAMGADPKKADSVPQPNLVFYHRTAASAAWKTGFAPFTGSSSMSYTTKTTEMNLSKTVNDHGTTTSPPTSWTYLYDGSSSYTLTEAWERGVGTVLTEVDTSTGAFNNNGSYNFNAGNESDEEYTWTGPSGEAHSKWHREETIEPGDFDARSTGHWSIKQFGSDAETGSWDERTSPGSGGGGGAGPPFPSPVVTTAETVRTTTWELDAPYGFNGHASGGGTQVETLTGPIPDSAMVAALAGDFGLQEAWPATFDGSGDGTSQLTLLSGYSASGSATQYYYKLEWPEGTPERVKQTGNYPRSYLIQENYRSDDLSVQKKGYKHITLKPGESSEPMLLSAITFDSSRSGLAWVGPDSVKTIELSSTSAAIATKSFAAPQVVDLNQVRPSQSELTDPLKWARGLNALVVFYDRVLDRKANVAVDFEVSMIPTGWNSSVWSKIGGPDSGSFAASQGKYLNPKVGGTYQFECAFNEGRVQAQFVLPLAGAEMKTWLLQEVRELKAITQAHRKAAEDENYSKVPGLTSWRLLKVFKDNSAQEFDYELDPVSSDRSSPSLCFKPQTRYEGGDEWTMYSYLTIGGTVVHGSKINNLLWGAFGYYWGWDSGELQNGASFNQFMRGIRLNRYQTDNRASQEAVLLGAYMAHIYSTEPNTSLLWQVTSPKSVWEALVDETYLIEEKLWPSHQNYSQTYSNFTRPILSTKSP